MAVIVGARAERLIKLVRHQLTSGSSGAAALFALSSCGFALGNLLLARSVPVTEFGQLALGIAAYMLASQLAPLGTDQMIVRRSLGYSRRLTMVQAASGAATGLVVGGATAAFAGFTMLDALFLALAIAGGSVLLGASAAMRVHGNRQRALMFFAAPNFVLLLVGIIAELLPALDLSSALALFAAGIAGIAALAAEQALVFPVPASEQPLAGGRFSIQESLSLLGMAAVGSLSMQMERLILPALLDFRSLAVFTVLSSLTIFPFRMLSTGMNFALTPSLNATADMGAAWKLIKAELTIVALVLVAAAAAVVMVVPHLVPLLTHGRYALPVALVLAGCAAGVTRILQALLRTVATALGSVKVLHQAHAVGWLSVVVSLAGAVFGSRWGLTGLVLGGAVGSGAVTLPTLAYALFHLRRRARSI